jgi:ribosomal protein L40E
MSKPDPWPTPEPVCWDCGATNVPGASECWLCQRRDWREHPGLRPRHPASPPPQRGPLSTIAGWMILIAVIGVAAGLLREAPGLAVVLLVIVGPALATTEVKASRRRRRGEPMSSWEWTLWVLGLMFLIPIVLIVAVAIALFLYCSALGIKT